MAVAAAALIEPTGPLTTSLFPGEDGNALAVRVDAYLTAALTDPRVAAIIAADGTKTDAAKTAYALFRAYSAVVQRMNSEPLTVNVTEKGGHGYSTAQIGAMQQLADKYDAALDALLPVASQPVAGLSVGIPNVFSW
jgi:hypothetical protein